MMMDCRDLTNDLLVGRLDSEVRVHLEGCPDCRARREELQSLEADLGALGRALGGREDRALVRGILAALPRAPASKFPAWRWAAGLAAAAAVLLIIVFASSEPPAPPRAEMVAVPAPPPIESLLDPVPPAPPPVPPLPPTPVPDKTPAPVVPAPVLPPAPPAPVNPVPPAPKPVEVPRPMAPPTQPAAPTRVTLALSGIDGNLEAQDGAAWKKLAKAAEWDASSPLRSADRPARFTLPDGTRVSLRPRSEVRLLVAEPPSLALEKGEAFFEVIPGAGRRFSVVTPDARIEVTGTQFSVKRSERTEVLVSAGEVVLSNEKGEARLPAGTGSSARKGSAPSRPRVVDADRAHAWRRDLDGPEVSRFRYDFEDGRLPLPWTSGKVVAGPARGINRSCLEGGPGVDADLSRADKRATVVHGALKFRFRYWTSDADTIWVQLFSERARDNFRFDLKGVAHGKWETVEIAIPDFYRLADGSHPQEGDRFTWLNFSVSGAKSPVYFDDIELVEVQK